MDYTMFSKDGKAVAGCGPVPMEGLPPVWNSYVNVDSVDDTIAKVEAAGGTVVMPAMDVMTAGRMAFVADPTGASFGLWQAGDHKGAQLVNEDGTLTWNELITDDPGRATAFYSAALGWRAEDSDMPGDIEYTTWMVGEDMVGGMMPKTEQMGDMPNNWGVYFSVDDCEGSAAKVKQLGGSVLREPFDTPVGRMAVVADPQGAAFMVITFEQQSE